MKISDHQKMAEMDGQIKQSSKNKTASINEAKPSVKADNESSTAAGSDNVSLSSKARDLQEARKALDAAPDVRMERVEELKNRIESGSYNVKGEAIADGIIKAALLDKKV